MAQRRRPSKKLRADAERLHLPMLILQVELDYQVSMKDFENWKTALGDRPDVRLRSFPELNHLFIAGEDQKPCHAAVQVVDEIARWIISLAP